MVRSAACILGALPTDAIAGRIGGEEFAVLLPRAGRDDAAAIADLIRRDHGEGIANTVSRRLVFTAHREGGQRQFVPRPVPEAADTSLSPLLDWARERLDSPLTVADLAAGRPLREALVTAAAVGAANAAVPGGALFDDATLARLRERTRAVELPGPSR